MDLTHTLMNSLPAVSRLALVYAPRRAREQTLALLALDARLAELMRGSSEPMLAQLRLAWWREALERPTTGWPEGEPIFAALRSWQGQHSALVPLVDGWEALTAPPPLEANALKAFAEGRAAGSAALARTVGAEDNVEEARSLGRMWALEDLNMRLSRSDERELARTLAVEEPLALPRTGRALRPLRVIAALSRRRRVAANEAAASSPGAVVEALRRGLLGL
ncbi:squalene/phytoene synthase family protein [Novosphingobium sp. M1R2S20]|uniref:Squalene/phytoene synthase family protein n=1 Tax=Novosphingobium rhizovicinum TaxID=3228928 RepID=A0ABV3RBT0_9SPHN